MKSSRFFVVGTVALILLLAAACEFSASTANIRDAYMVRDVNGQREKTTTFAQDENFYCIVELANAPDDTTMKAAWYVVDVEGVEANYFIDEAEIAQGDGEITFDLTNDALWPIGIYRVDLFLNGEANRSLEFEVQ